MNTIDRVVDDPDGVRHTIQVKPRGVVTLMARTPLGLMIWLFGWPLHAVIFRFGWDVIVYRSPRFRRRFLSAAGAQHLLRTHWPSRDAAELEQDRLPDVIEAGRFPDGPWART